MPRLVTLVVTALLGLALSGCTGGGSNPAPTTSAPTAAERLAAAKADVDRAPSMHLTLTSRDLPQDVTGVVSADGWGKHPPAFKGTFQVKVKGVAADAQVVAVDGKTYAKLPFVQIFREVTPASIGAPDPARLFDPDSGLTSLLTATQAPVFGERTRKGAEVLQTITGTLDGKLITDLLATGNGTGSYRVTYGLTDAWQLRSVAITGPFFGADSTYELTFDRYGEPVEIVRP